MAVTRKKPAKRAPKPRTPARVKQRPPKTRKTRSHHHPELWGLGMVAVGLFLATVLWFGWDGGAVGATVVDGLHGAFGVAAYVIPLVLLCDRRADARAQQARRPEAVPHGPRRRCLRADDRPRPRRGRRDRRRPRRRPRARDRRHRRADRRRRPLHRRHASLHRCLGRRRPAPLGHRGAAGRERRAAHARRSGGDGRGQLRRRARAGAASPARRCRRELPRRDRARGGVGRAAAARDAGRGAPRRTRSPPATARRSTSTPRRRASTACPTARC